MCVIMSLLRTAQLSCDVYKTRSCLERSYVKYKPRFIQYQGTPFSMTLYDQSKNNLYVVFRGCKDVDEVVECINTNVKRPFRSRHLHVNSSFWNKYESLKDEIEDTIKSYDTGSFDQIIFTGHSLGGAMAQLAGAFCSIPREVSCHTFGAPYVGDIAFKHILDSKLEHKRCIVKQDIIPKIKFNPRLIHNGVELELASVSNMPFPLNIYDHHTCLNYLKCLKHNGVITNKDDVNGVIDQ